MKDSGSRKISLNAVRENLLSTRLNHRIIRLGRQLPVVNHHPPIKKCELGGGEGDIEHRFERRDILERTPDEIDGNFLRLSILNGNIDTRSPPIEKCPHRIHRTVRKRCTHPTVSKYPRVRVRRLYLQGQLRWRGGRGTRWKRLSGLG